MAKDRSPDAFQPDEEVSHAFVRALDRMSVEGRRLAEASPGPLQEAIHVQRLLIKRSRALLWLARPVVAPGIFEESRANLRAAARLLAAHRDVTATRLTLEKLKRKTSGRRRKALAHAARMMSRVAEAGEFPDKERHLRLRESAGVFGGAVKEIKGAVAGREAWPPLAGRLEKAFRTMSRAGKKATATARAEEFHQWRKKAKRLLYLLEFAGAEPKRRKARLIKKVDKLQAKLGDYHDCVVAGESLRTKLPDEPVTRAALARLKKREAQLGKRARKIARRIKPDA